MAGQGLGQLGRRPLPIVGKYESTLASPGDGAICVDAWALLPSCTQARGSKQVRIESWPRFKLGDDLQRRRLACHKSFRNSIFMGAPTRRERAGYSEMRSADPGNPGRRAGGPGSPATYLSVIIADRGHKGTCESPQCAEARIARRVDTSLICEMDYRARTVWVPTSVKSTAKQAVKLTLVETADPTHSDAPVEIRWCPSMLYYQILSGE